MSDKHGVFADTALKIASIAAYTLEKADTAEDQLVGERILLAFRMPLSVSGAALLKDADADARISLLDLHTIQVTTISVLEHYGHFFRETFKEECALMLEVVEGLINEATTEKPRAVQHSAEERRDAESERV